MNDPLHDKVLKFARVMQIYHRHRVVGIEHIPKQGPAIIAVNHSLATYDTALLGAAIFRHTGRWLRALGDRAIFRTPYLGSLAKRLGVEQGSPVAGMQLLAAGNILLLAPGGMLEALRAKSERYQIYWENRRGFVRLAMQAKVPIILAACPRADDIYRVYDNPLTTLVYEAMRMPLPVARGLGLTAVPRPIRLVHAVSEPHMAPELREGEDFETAVDAFHKTICGQMRELMLKALRY